MPWIEAHVKTSAEHANDVSTQLETLGAVAVTFQDAGDEPIFEPTPDTPRLWHHTIVVGLYDANHPIEQVIQFLEKQQARGLIDGFHIQHLEDQDWERVCLKGFTPMQFGKRVWICPSWHTPPDPDGINIVLDPGLAFGTGTHPTTALCLEWLDQHMTGDEDLVIDYGCGSGILAIAALKLGAKTVLAIDHDTQALEATHENGLRNGFSTAQLATALPNNHIEAQANVLIANILAQPLISLASTLAKLTKLDGKIVLSGILIEQTMDIMNAYKPWFDMHPPSSLGEWVRLSGTKIRENNAGEN